MGPCDICGQEPQAMQIGDMTSGDQKFVCVGCFARFGLDFAKAVLPAEEVAAVLGPMFVTPAREDLHEEAKAETQKRARKSKAQKAAPEREAGGEAETPTAAAE